MDLIINNKIIETPIYDIVSTIRDETGGKYFNLIGKDGKEHLQVQCPFHSSGSESHMSASFYNDATNPDIEYGFFKCFTCGEMMPLYAVVAHCFGKDYDNKFGKQWLVDNFGSIISASKQLQPLREKKKKSHAIILDESVLDNYNYFHPYMEKRNLSRDIIAKYKVGYDPETDSLTFPCWDYLGRLTSITRRTVKGKNFKLASDTNKDIYLLNFALNENSHTLWLAESQINALTLQQWGYQGVAFFGTGTKHQYEILKKCGVSSFVLVLDGDVAGRSGELRFIKEFINRATISIKDIPNGKDVNDLTQSEFENCPLLSIDEWCSKYGFKI